MTRDSADSFRCVLCGCMTYERMVICRECEVNERRRQFFAQGSITVPQIYFIEKK